MPSDLFSIVAQQILIFLIYALVGVYAVKRRIIGAAGLETLASFIIKIALPLMIFSYTIGACTKTEFIAALPLLAGAAVLYALLFGAGLVLAPCFTFRPNERRVYRACAMFGNVGFMGIPVICAIFGPRGMLYMSLFTVIDQLLIWTVGITLATPDAASAALTKGQKLKKMLNPATCAVALSVLGIFSGVTLPDFFHAALLKIGSCATPLALVYLGGLFALMDLRGYFKRPELYAAVLVKMLVLPLFFYALTTVAPLVTREIALTLALLCAMPTMSALPMLAQSQHSAGAYAAAMVFVTTALSTLSLPLVSWALAAFF